MNRLDILDNLFFSQIKGGAKQKNKSKIFMFPSQNSGKRNKLLFITLIFLFSLIFVSASRLPSVGSDNSTWGDILNDYLTKLAGANATELNLTMVNGTNIYSSSINTTHILNKTITGNDLADNSVNSSAIDLTEVTLSTFTNDANYLDKDEGGIIDGSLVVNGNFTLIGSYLNATVTNQYLNGSFLPDITNLFDLGSSLLKWANLYVTNLYASKVYSDDWSNVTIQESQISDLQSYLTSETDSLAYNGTLAYNSSLSNYYLDSNPLNFLNQTQTDLLYAILGYGDDWNKTYADTIYLNLSGANANTNIDIGNYNFTSSWLKANNLNITGNAYLGELTWNGNLDLNGNNLILNGGYVSGDGDNEGIFVDSSGRVGIGTTTPQNKLNVAGDGNFTGNLYGGTVYSGGSAVLTSFTETDPYWTGNMSNVAFINKANAFGAFNQNFDTGTFFIDATNHRVGIGTTEPGTKLNIEGSDGNLFRIARSTDSADQLTCLPIQLTSIYTLWVDTICALAHRGGLQTEQA